MNFVQQLEECLRDLASAARQRHPGVKEASERAVLKLRSLQAGYVSAVRRAASSKEHPTTSLFQSSDLLHPFLLAANYPNADYKLLEISFRAMRLLMEADAVVPTDSIHMVRVYQIQAVVVTAYYQKQYAKEILRTASEAADNAEEDEDEAEGDSNEKDADSSSEVSAPVETSTSSSSGWFSWGNSSNSGGTKMLNSSQHGGSSKIIKNAVSSSTGQTGQAAQSSHHMEKLALEILSSLLQLMELLRNYPSSLTSTELWTSATALACLWFYLPPRHTVQQAAHSTVSQLISLLYQTTENHKLSQSTWEDLLALTESERTKRTVTLQGAFKLCKRKADGSSTAALPPSPEFALELMTQVWKEHTAGRNAFDPADTLLVKSMGVTMTLLQKLPKISVEKSLRVVQWTLALFQSHANTFPNECRELFLQLVKQIPAATDACRKHHDFEDGYVYSAQQQQSDAFSSLKDDSTNGVRKSAAESLIAVFPLTALWKAGFVLEATYHILDKDSNELSVLFDDGRTVQSLAEALSDFATIGTSCRDHILQVVDFCGMQNPSSLKPTVFRKAEQGIAAGAKFSDPAVVSSSKGSDKNKAPIQILGEGIWLSLQGILRIGDCLQQCAASEVERKILFDDIFPPSLSVLQHFLKRFVGSEELVRLALEGYSTLADTCLPIKECSVERKVLLTSLSKLSLPSWGKHDTSCQLQDHHVRSLLCLLRIVHLHFDSIASEWEIVLWTLEELSVLDIASPLLTDEAYYVSLAISAVYQRFASFSTCFSEESLTHMTAALSEICQATMSKRDVVGDSETVLPERTNNADLTEKASPDERETISGKIMSIGVRAIYGSAASDSDKHDEISRVERTKNAYYEDYRNDFISRLTTSKYSLRTNSIGRIPFALVLFSDIAMTNMFRSKECGLTISTQFSRLAAASPIIRPLVMDIITMLMLSQLSSEQDLPQLFKGPGKIVFEDPMQSQLLAVEPADSAIPGVQRHLSQAEVLAPLCESIQNAEKADVAKASLDVLNTILEGTGQNLSGEVWPLMIDAIASLSGDSSYRVGRSTSEWSACCLMAFRSLKLIVDDFLGQLPGASDVEASTHISLLDCCSSFVVSRHDINTSLTAIGLLWTIADQDSDSASIDRALSKLVLLSSDDRPEVRNAAVNTLFSCIAGRGSGFSPSYWKSCITSTVFRVYDIVADKVGAGLVDGEVKGNSASRYQVRLHHSRDSSGKMWVATQVLVLQGLTRVLRIFFSQLLDNMDGNGKNRGDTDDAFWFQDAWVRILDFAFDAASQGAGRDNLDIRLVGVELLVVCCQLASKAGIQAAVAPARVSTNMEVVNGALRSVRESQPSKVAPERTNSEATDYARQRLFLAAFESLEAFELEVLRKRKAEDDTDLQILNRFCANLGRLYDCCRGNEFKVENGVGSLQSLIDSGREVTDPIADVLETRFVRIVVSVMATSGGDANARFLNQGQRGSLDLLRAMAAYGSSVAFERLVFFAGFCFFVRKDSECDESENFEDDEKHPATLLNFEAAAAVSQEICKDDVSDECRAFVLYIVLADFLAEHHTNELRQRRYYKRFVPIIRSGIESTARLAARDDKVSSKAVGMIWARVLKCLSQMLTPIPLGKDLIKIPRVSEILAIVTTARANVPVEFASDLCGILSFGASKAFDAARQHAINAEANPEGDFGRKSKRHRDDLLKLFFVCFSGCCSLGPEEPSLHTLADTVLTGAASKTIDSMYGLCTEASLMVCLAMEEYEKMDVLIISVFPALCRLIMSDSSKLKDAAGKVLTDSNIAETLHDAQIRCELSEKRATEAERRVTELEAAVTELQEEKSRLQQEVSAAQEPRRGLW